MWRVNEQHANTQYACASSSALCVAGYVIVYDLCVSIMEVHCYKSICKTLHST